MERSTEDSGSFESVGLAASAGAPCFCFRCVSQHAQRPASTDTSGTAVPSQFTTECFLVSNVCSNVFHRPAWTDKVDSDALMIGVPSGSLSEDSFPMKQSFYFVIIDDSEPAVLEARTASTKALRLGALLGAGLLNPPHALPLSTFRAAAEFQAFQLTRV